VRAPWNGEFMPDLDPDAIDLRILRALQADGRLTNQELADQVGLSPSPCLRRVAARSATDSSAPTAPSSTGNPSGLA